VNADATCWTMIRAAADGGRSARERCGRAYLPVVRAYLAARWRGAAVDVDDAVQDVFVECFRGGGALEKVEAGRSGGFRAFLIGVARNVARRFEDRRRADGSLPDGVAADETGPAEAFERAWARTLLREAARLQGKAAEERDEAARRRVELLQLRFQDGRPIRDIARQWGVDPAKLHREYAVAREEFRSALREVVAFHHPGAPTADVERICLDLVGHVG
jgi:RNA polymerase sigma-70 factor (ECF subfamily)